MASNQFVKRQNPAMGSPNRALVSDKGTGAAIANFGTTVGRQISDYITQKNEEADDSALAKFVGELSNELLDKRSGGMQFTERKRLINNRISDSGLSGASQIQARTLIQARNDLKTETIKGFNVTSNIQTGDIVSSTPSLKSPEEQAESAIGEKMVQAEAGAPRAVAALQAHIIDKLDPKTINTNVREIGDITQNATELLRFIKDVTDNDNLFNPSDINIDDIDRRKQSRRSQLVNTYKTLTSSLDILSARVIDSSGTNPLINQSAAREVLKALEQDIRRKFTPAVMESFGYTEDKVDGLDKLFKDTLQTSTENSEAISKLGRTGSINSALDQIATTRRLTTEIEKSKNWNKIPRHLRSFAAKAEVVKIAATLVDTLFPDDDSTKLAFMGGLIREVTDPRTEALLVEFEAGNFSLNATTNYQNVKLMMHSASSYKSTKQVERLYGAISVLINASNWTTAAGRDLQSAKDVLVKEVDNWYTVASQAAKNLERFKKEQGG